MSNNFVDFKENLISFKQVTQEDYPLLLSWFKEPHVASWWPVPEEHESFEHFLIRIRSRETYAYFVMIDNKPIGYIQYYLIDRNNEKTGSWLPPLPQATIGTDQFIGNSDYLNKGYGTVFIKEFIGYLKKELYPEVTTLIVDPEPSNTAAIRCYEKVGFVSMGTYEAPWGPAVLMRYDIK